MDKKALELTRAYIRLEDVLVEKARSKVLGDKVMVAEMQKLADSIKAEIAALEER